MLKKLWNKAVPKWYGFYFNGVSHVSKDRGATLALQVFSTPRKGSILPFQHEFLETSQQQKLVNEEGFTQVYHWKGNGKTILLAHGWESNAWRWKYLIEPLQKLDYNIIAIDAPAHGNSSGEEFTAVKYSRILRSIIELYRPEIIVAHSVGAMATSFQESQTPHSFIEKMVLLGSPNTLKAIMKDYQQLVGFSDRVYASLDRLLHRIYGFHIKDFNTEDFVAQIECPVLLIHNKSDAIVPYESMLQIAAQSPHATVYESKTGGHSLHTPEVVDQILAFL